ncbi:MAG: HAD hydrolase-like protein, partial [Planctomycetota bacterium]
MTPFAGIRAVLFDFDGTLTRPGGLDFAAIRRALGCPPGASILAFIDSLPSEEERAEARSKLDAFEMEAAARARPNRDAEEVVRALRRQGFLLGIFSRNSRRAILRSLQNFNSICAEDFTVILSREDTPLPKPAPDG